MVKQITKVPVNNSPVEEATPQVENMTNNEEVPPIVQAEPEPEPEPEPEIVEVKHQKVKEEKK